tara:strand:- start:252 stop:1166 length:915 start_codon:yes stop_codon:yes gene_type:complete
MKPYLYLLSIVLLAATFPTQADNGTLQATSLLGERLYAPAKVHPTVLAKEEEAKTAYKANPNDADAIIWYGRRIAYTGDYRAAIEVFSEGIKKHPKDARMYRHRGHRYISIRKLDEAIADYLKAVELIKGQENEIEPDGAPNARNIPVSTKHGNIWYHLGLAYYLKHDFEKALWAYTEARNTGKLPDNIVSTTHWIYMILRRMGREEEATRALDSISADMDIIENFAYYKLCLMYKGILSYDQLDKEVSGGPQGAGMVYGLANWKFYHDKQDEALAIMRTYVEKKQGWPAFGFIAAEADLAKYQ